MSEYFSKSQAFPKPKIRTVMIHASDSKRALSFWSALMSMPALESRGGPFTFLKRAEGDSFSIAIQQSESALSPNSAIHIDIAVENLDHAEKFITSLGGKITNRVTFDNGFEYRVAEDTEGNHFCIFVEHA
jgi:predicted enzyme related to lactoylglutathione lyase